MDFKRSIVARLTKKMAAAQTKTVDKPAELTGGAKLLKALADKNEAAIMDAVRACMNHYEKEAEGK